MRRLIKLMIISGFALSSNLVNANGKNEASANSMISTSITGRVVDKHTGEALTGVAVKLNNEILFTDFEGKFEVKDILPGDYSLSISYISYKEIDKNLKVEKVAGNLVELELEPLSK
jgi:hypothetical protein